MSNGDGVLIGSADVRVIPMIRLTFLGTAASRPTPGRNVSALSVQREGDNFLFDCGEGTQRQMMRYGTGFSVSRIFFTHMHADHFLGVIGLVRTMALQGREEPLALYGPPGSTRTLREAVHLGVDRVQFEVSFLELAPGERVEFPEYAIEAFRANHGVSAIGYNLRELPRLGRFDVEKARALGIPEGPLFGELHRGNPVEVDGRVITPEELVGPARPGRLVTYTGDTRPADSVREAARDADVLIHEATFTEDEGVRAHETYHSTALGAATVAAEAGVRSLLLTHVSARYADNAGPLLDEARQAFESVGVARDGQVVEIDYRADEE
jgi:ribonuclease Z